MNGLTAASRSNGDTHAVVTAANGGRYPSNFAGIVERLVHGISVKTLANNARIGAIFPVKSSKGLGIAFSCGQIVGTCATRSLQ
jgi:hypothetical protein